MLDVTGAGVYTPKPTIEHWLHLGNLASFLQADIFAALMGRGKQPIYSDSEAATKTVTPPITTLKTVKNRLTEQDKGIKSHYYGYLNTGRVQQQQRSDRNRSSQSHSHYVRGQKESGYSPNRPRPGRNT